MFSPTVHKRLIRSFKVAELFQSYIASCCTMGTMGERTYNLLSKSLTTFLVRVWLKYGQKLLLLCKTHNKSIQVFLNDCLFLITCSRISLIYFIQFGQGSITLYFAVVVFSELFASLKAQIQGLISSSDLWRQIIMTEALSQLIYLDELKTCFPCKGSQILLVIWYHLCAICIIT